MQRITQGAVLLMAIMLSGCQVIKTGPAKDTSSVRQMEQELEASLEQAKAKPDRATPPDSVNQALIPPLELDRSLSEPVEDRFDIAVDQLPARDFFIGLVRDTAYNMVVHPGITGNISLELKDVSVAEVMQVVRDVYGYDYEQSGNLFRVLPTGMRTQIFKINYLNVKRNGSSETQVSAGQVSSVDTSKTGTENDLDSDNLSDTGGVRAVVGTRIKTETQADFWNGLSATISMIVGGGEGRSVVVSPQAGIVVIKAYPAELRAAQEFLDKAELSLRRQVILEAKILEVQLNEGFQAGINWAAVAQVGRDKNIIFGNGLTQGSRIIDSDGSASLNGSIINVPNLQTDLSGTDIGGAFSAALNLKDFNGLIELLKTQGTVQVLSSPRISTVNNQKAVIKVGTDEFFVTEVSSQTTTTTTSSTPTVDVELTPFFSGIALDVTPQISDEGDIILHVHPTVSEVVDQSKTVAAPTGQLTLPLALSTIRESDTIIRARNGQVVVIGGLMQNSSTDGNAKTPVLGDVPFFGNAFRQKRQGSTKSELIILLRPVVATDEAWQHEIEKSRENVKGLREAIEPGFFK